MKKSILVVDDDASIREFLRRLFEKNGYAVREAADGREALRLMREAPADCVVTDIIMPEKEGIETILEIRRGFPETQIVAISGGGRIGPLDYLKMAGLMGARRVFAKPLRSAELLEAVGSLLQSCPAMGWGPDAC